MPKDVEFTVLPAKSLVLVVAGEVLEIDDVELLDVAFPQALNQRVSPEGEGG